MRHRPVEPISLQLRMPEGHSRAASDLLAGFIPRLELARNELLSVSTAHDGPGFFSAKELLNNYHAKGRGIRHSELGRLLGRARKLADKVDRVVVVAVSSIAVAAKAVLAACAHPYHNELSRAQRGGYPRISFAARPADNDELAGLLDLLAGDGSPPGLDARWALLTVDDGTAETAIKSRVLEQALQTALASGTDLLAELSIKVAKPDDVAAADPLSPAVLLPAALAGLDVVGLLAGAAAMIERFAAEPPDTCPPLMLAGLARLTHSEPTGCRLEVWHNELEPLAAWYAELLAFFSRPGSLHAAPAAEKIRRLPLAMNVVADRPRRDRLPLDELGETGNTVWDLMQQNLEAGIKAQQAAGRMVLELRLPRINERAIGQLMQMLVLATAVEARLSGQPGTNELSRNLA